MVSYVKYSQKIILVIKVWFFFWQIIDGLNFRIIRYDDLVISEIICNGVDFS